MKNLKRFDIPASYEADIPKQEYQVSWIENPESVKFDGNGNPPVSKKNKITIPQEFFESPGVNVTLIIDSVTIPVESNIIEIDTGKTIILNIVVSDANLYELDNLACTPAITAFATAQDNTGCSIINWKVDQDIVITGILVRHYLITLPAEFVNNPNCEITVTPKNAGVLKDNVINCVEKSRINVNIALTNLDYMFTNGKCTPSILSFKDETVSGDNSRMAIYRWIPNQDITISGNIIKRPKMYSFNIAPRLIPICNIIDKNGDTVDSSTLPLSISEGTEIAYKIVPKDKNKYKFVSAVATKLSKDSYYKCTESSIEILPHVIEKDIMIDVNADVYYKLTYRFNIPNVPEMPEPEIKIDALTVVDKDDNYIIDEKNIPVPKIDALTNEYYMYYRPEWMSMCNFKHTLTYVKKDGGIILTPNDGIITDYSISGYDGLIEHLVKSVVKDTVVEFNLTDDRRSAFMEANYDYDKFIGTPNLTEENPWIPVIPNENQILIAKV